MQVGASAHKVEVDLRLPFLIQPKSYLPFVCVGIIC